MALVKNDTDGLTLDDLLEAVNPSRTSLEERFRRALVSTIKYWQGGQLTDEQAEVLIKAIVSASVNRQVNEMVNDFFTPRNRRVVDAARRRTSLM